MKKRNIINIILCVAVSIALICFLARDVLALASPEGVVTTKTSLYTYETLENDLRALKAKYQERVHCFAFGSSAYGLPLYAVRVGSENARHKVLITANTHAREYMTVQLVMLQIEKLCTGYESESYHGVSYKSILESAAVYFVPSINPDGTRISQFGSGKIPPKYRNEVSRLPLLGEAYSFARWKTNGRGVDLNRNYSPGWEYNGGAASKNSGGDKAESEPEVKALMNLCRDNSFDLCISYHSGGEVIFWRQEGLMDEISYPLAKKISTATTYLLNDDDTSKGGFKGWFAAELFKPCFTVEIGLGASPLPLCQLENIYRQNEYVPLICAWELYSPQ